MPCRMAIPRYSMKARIWLMMPGRHQLLALPIRLQIQPLRGLGRDELHRRALHGFGNRIGIIEVILLSLVKGADGRISITVGAPGRPARSKWWKSTAMKE